jgi:hypothetical protein
MTYSHARATAGTAIVGELRVAEADGEALDGLASVPSPGRGEVRLALLALGGEPAGRERFERMITALVIERHPSARTVRPNPGDWGIDTHVGSLAGGRVAVWQSKFFLTGVGDSQRKQVRDSFASVCSAAGQHGFKVASWTLALPIDLDGDESKWWEGWKRRTERKSGAVVDLWTGSYVEHLLRQDDFASVRQQFFGLARDERPIERTLQDPEDWATYDGALFIRQLAEASITEDQPARRAFFNAEVLARDIADREVPREVDALRSMKATLHQMWSTRYELHKGLCPDGETMLPALYPEVMAAVEESHLSDRSPTLRDTLVHRSGLVHHLVEAGDAGWVLDFRRVAAAHEEGPA